MIREEIGFPWNLRFFLYLLPVFTDNAEFDALIFYLKSVYLPVEYSVKKKSHVFCLMYLVLKNVIVSVTASFEELELQNCSLKVKF